MEIFQEISKHGGPFTGRLSIDRQMYIETDRLHLFVLFITSVNLLYSLLRLNVYIVEAKFSCSFTLYPFSMNFLVNGFSALLPFSVMARPKPIRDLEYLALPLIAVF